MISVEERLRAAARAAAATVADGSAPKLRLPGQRYGTLAQRRRVVRWVAPLTAALAVIAVVVAAAVLRGTAVGPGPAKPTGLPRYFVALADAGQFNSSKIVRIVAIVGNTATGKPIVTITPPKPYDAFVRVTAAANGTRYVLAAEGLNRRDAPYYGKTAFYELRITSSGSRTTVKTSPVRIPVLGQRAFSDIALSPDGTRLAVTRGRPGLGNPEVRVYDLATGKARTWVLPSSEMWSIPAIATPSWEANGRYLALDVSSRSRAVGQCADCIRLLDTATSGGNILTNSRLLVRSPKSDFFVNWTAALITPDGRRMLRSAIVPVGKNSNDDRPWIYVYNAGSGALVRSMTGSLGVRWTVLWSSPDGRAFVVSRVSQNSHIRVIRAVLFSDGRWHRVPLPPQTLTVAW